MNRIWHILGNALAGVVLAAFLLLLLLLFGSQSLPLASPTAQPTASPLITLLASSTAIPLTPTPLITITPTPATIVLEGVTIEARKAAFLRNSDLWIVESGGEPRAITSFGDVSAIFGWNHEGTQILIGRGRKKHPGHISDTTDLWVFNPSTRDARQLTTGSNVHTAGWSPVDNRVAYCEQDNGLTVIDPSGNMLSQQAKVLCVFTWSPDGMLIAAESFVQPPKPGDEIEDTRLVVINLSNGTITTLAEQGAYYGFLWDLDGKRFLFQWARSNRPLGESLWYVADIQTGTVKVLDSAPSLAGISPMRSPRGDLLVFTIGETIYVMDFEGKTQFTTRTKSPTWATWAPDGVTLLYCDSDGKLVARKFQMARTDSEVGGGMPAPVLYDYQGWEFYFTSQ